MLWFSGAELRVTGLPETGWDRPAIYVMNHQSSLDIPAAFAVLPVDLRFIAKHTLRKVPFLGWYMSWTGMVFVDRSNSTQAVGSLNAAAERVRGGISLLAYPEGTRSRDGRILPFKKGPFVLALQAGVPIVPFAIQGSLRVMPSGLKPLRPGGGPDRVRRADPHGASCRWPSATSWSGARATRCSPCTPRSRAPTVERRTHHRPGRAHHGLTRVRLAVAPAACRDGWRAEASGQIGRPASCCLAPEHPAGGGAAWGR